VCDAVEGVILSEPDLGALEVAAGRARSDGMGAAFLRDGPLGDAIVLAAGMAVRTPDILFGVLVGLEGQPHRHPTVLAREMTTFDDVCGGRSVVAFGGPFADPTSEAIALCRAMWRKGVGVSEGPYYPVAGAINNPRPHKPGGPLVALDLTDGFVPTSTLLAACDLVLVPTGATPPASLPAGVSVCHILGL
jgi:alkanesulfonate monooxygenase SsuD/methylene tetrahydromethanopterin reductase-like flavin-dependent oxidoreductase (luciferase family)